MAIKSYMNSAGHSLSLSGVATKSIMAAVKGMATGTLGNDALRTGGSSTLSGGTGDDTYFVYTSKDVVIEKAGQGIDTVNASAPSYVLPDNVENLVVGGSHGLGNGLDNLIIGGGSGAQTLDGGAGNDVLVAGAGADTFVVAKGQGSDVIYGFKAASDRVQLNDHKTLASFEAVKAALTQVGADTVLTLGGGETLTLRNQKAADLSASNFRLPLDTSTLKLSFADEFDSFTSSPKPGHGWQTAFGFGRTLTNNKEVEYYSDSSVGVNPFHVQDGVLDITARRGTEGVDTPAGSGLSWTSGMIRTYGSFSQTYGYFEMRAELPAGQGLWPAFWLMPTDGSWPPELDIMEMHGDKPTQLFTTAHSASTGKHTGEGYSSFVGDMTKGYHTYGVNWQADTITWYFDGNAVAQAKTPADMNKPMYIMANLAVGGVGSWPGPTDPGLTEAHMKIDYIRAYTVTPEALAAPLATSTDVKGLFAGAPAADAPPSVGPRTLTDIFWQNSDGSFTSWNVSGGSIAYNAVHKVAASWHVRGMGDFNGDGRADVLWQNDNGAVATSAGGSDGSFQSSAVQSSAASWHAEHVADVNGDGRSDILWRNDDGSFTTWINSSNGSIGYGAVQKVATSWQIKDAGDFNGDGRADLLWQDANGSITVWTTRSDGAFDYGPVQQVAASWHAEKAGDFDGDGRADILWRNDDGALTVWTSRADGGVDYGALYKVSTDWHVAAARDFTGDVRADILWQNDNGSVAIWDSTGNGFHAHDVAKVDASWHIYA